MLQQWRALFTRGASIGIPTGILTALSLAYAAYARQQSDPEESTAWKGLAFAAAMAIGIIPFTLLVLNPTNKRLIAAGEGRLAIGDTEAKELVGKWARLNLGRTVLPIVGTIVGVSTVLIS